MMEFLVILFWISLGILFYCYTGYGILVFLIVGLKKIVVPAKQESQIPGDMPVTIIVSAYNERPVIEQKIHNILELDYPSSLLNIIFVTDGSDDGSTGIISKYPNIRLLHDPERKGKYAAIKKAMRYVEGPVVFFSDANAMMNPEAIKKMLIHYNDEKTGGVAGEKKIIVNNKTSSVGEGEGLYWKYESLMKSLDAGLHTVIGAAGELYSIRTSLFRELPDELIIDDFIISMQVCLQGYRIKYEPSAFASELPSASLPEEEKRKVRISAGAYQSIGFLKECLHFWQHPLLSFQFISRRLLRWLLCPFLLVILFVSNGLLVIYNSSPFYGGMFSLQLIFYLMAATGWLFINSGKKAGLFTIPFYFVFMNYCLVKGFIRFMNGKQTVLWQKSLRQATS